MPNPTSTAPDAPLAQSDIPFERERTKIAVGISTVMGYIAAAATAAVPLVAWAADLGVGDPKVWAGMSAILVIATQAGRYGQAIAKIVKEGPGA